MPDKDRGKDYNHSGFIDLIISGLIGLRPRSDGVLEIHPLLPEGVWDHFCLDLVLYHDHWLTILYDRRGTYYGKGAGLRVFDQGFEIAIHQDLSPFEVKLKEVAVFQRSPDLPLNAILHHNYTGAQP